MSRGVRDDIETLRAREAATRNNESEQQMSESLIATYENEPSWLKISWAYNDLHKATAKLHADIGRYKAALNELDGAGTDVGFGKERIAELREEIKQLEATTP